MQSVGKHFNLIKRWLVFQLELQAEALFLWIPVCLGAGIALYFSMPVEPSPSLLLIFILSLGCLLFKAARIGLWGRYAALAVAFVGIGFCAGQVRTLIVDAPMLMRDMDFVSVSGRVAQVEYTALDRSDYVLVLDHVSVEHLDALETPEKLRISVRSKAALDGLAPGVFVRGLAALRKPEGAFYPEGFDYRRFLFFKRIGAAGYFYGAPEIIDNGVPSDRHDYVERLRTRLQQSIYKALPEQEAGVAAALVVGMKAGVGKDDYEDIRQAGLAHMLAISGLHIGLFAGLVFFIVRLALALVPYCALHWSIKGIAAVAAMAAALLYMVIAGATLPTQRAVLMALIVLLGICLGRPAISMRVVACAAIVLLLLMPETLLSIGFQLSFSAVVALVAFYEWAQGRNNNRERSFVGRRVVVYGAGVVVTSVVAFIATMPFALCAFHSVPLYGVFANFVAIPVLTFCVMPFALLGVLVSLVGGNPEGVFALMHGGLSLILDIVHFVAEQQAVLAVPAFPFAYAVAAACGGLGAVLLRGAFRYVAVGCSCAAIVLIFIYPVPDIYVAPNHKVRAIIYAADKDVGGFVDSQITRAGKPYVSWSTLRRERFVRDSVTQALGVRNVQVQQFDRDPRMRCDDLGCRVTVKGRKISFAQRSEAVQQECQWADTLVARFTVAKRAAKCAAPDVVDYARNGGARSEGLFGYIDLDGHITWRGSRSGKKRPWTVE